jgi:hypothetical protein
MYVSPSGTKSFSISRTTKSCISNWERRTPTGKWDDLVRVDEPRPKKNAVGAAHKHQAAGLPQRSRSEGHTYHNESQSSPFSHVSLQVSVHQPLAKDYPFTEPFCRYPRDFPLDDFRDQYRRPPPWYLQFIRAAAAITFRRPHVS